MRYGVGIGIALVLLSAGAAMAVETARAGSPKTKAVKVVSAETVGTAPSVVPKTSVTRVTKTAPVRRKSAKPTLVARIDLTGQRMRVTSNGKLVGSWKISSGKLGHQTPPGRFRPKWTSKMHYSRKYNNSPMPYSVFFNGGIATHGTSYVNRLGGPASHGCIRLKTGNARKFYNLVHAHGYKRTKIVVTGRANFSRTAHRNYKNKRGSYRVRQARRISRVNNSFAAAGNAWGQNAYSTRRTSRQRHSLNRYDRTRRIRHRQRVQRYQQRRLIYPGDVR